MSAPRTFRVDRAAVQTRSGTVFSLQRPARHAEVLAHMLSLCGDQRGLTLGFVLSSGEFVDREQAREIAEAGGQLLKRAGSRPELYSEDVW